jgi:hypothetical protein
LILKGSTLNKIIRQIRIMKAILLTALSILFISSCRNQSVEEKKDKTVKEDVVLSKTQKEDSNKQPKELKIEVVPETNFDFYKTKFVKSSENNAKIEKWLRQIVANDKDLVFDGSSSYMTKECLNYVTDVIDYTWGYPGSIDEETFKKKWKQKFDINKINFDHLFENGDGGWSVKVLSNVQYLGELNDGKWFQLTIKGGMNENENKLIRVVKVIENDNSYFISNFLGI